ncbi:MAG: NAD-dependent malic enzyme, partial [Kytococcus sp.]|nr:NAD-dependent malic enzyme [Kytococcus sp.]
RGLLDAHAENVTVEMLIRAADAIAAVVKDEEINPSYIIPSVFHPDVADTVAVAIAGEGKTSAGATGPIKVGSRSTAAPVDETGVLPRVR